MTYPYFFRVAKKVWFFVDNPVNTSAYYGYECADELQAEAFKRLFQDRFTEIMTYQRENAYELGWKDAKAKRKRRTYFSGWLP